MGIINLRVQLKKELIKIIILAMQIITFRLLFLCVAIGVSSVCVTSCSSINKTQRTTSIGSAAGSSIGAKIGRRAGNSAVGATLGAFLGGSTGALIGRGLDGLSNNSNRNKAHLPLYVIDGIMYKEKEAQTKLNHINSNKILSIKVLKNVEATAIYGNKGENGAILIELDNI